MSRFGFKMKKGPPVLCLIRLKLVLFIYINTFHLTFSGFIDTVLIVLIVWSNN